ncbi:TIR domain-containing protein [Salinimonas chungwhensis]|uniref:TIR domain-containing protein n=1 Tax=Salinimonas chungwhensis TaxID=265425 RepID=UPI00035CCF8F|nr:TIR domain-containing protein [Salinimonas chungwhensis]
MNNSSIVLKKLPQEEFISASTLTAPLAGAFIGNLFAPGIGGMLVGGLLGSLFNTEESKKNMAKIPVFYSFHFQNDVMRVQQIRNIGSIEGNSAVNPNEWERIKQKGSAAIQYWIDQNMKYKRCVIVLIGTDTANRPWVKYEIERAWNQGKALLGIHINNIRCARNGTCRKGANPFEQFTFSDGRKLSSFVPCYEPEPTFAYRDIAQNISGWINHAIQSKRN